MIFPKFDHTEVIDRIRKKYDPLANLVDPHITIVFPFQSEMSDKELSDILDKRLNDIKPFEVELQGFSKCENSSGNYLFLDIIKGKENIITIHKRLYDIEFGPFDSGLEYAPHITVGKLSDAQELIRAFDDIKNIDSKFVSLVDRISVEMIGDKEESIIVIEKELQQ